MHAIILHSRFANEFWGGCRFIVTSLYLLHGRPGVTRTRDILLRDRRTVCGYLSATRRDGHPPHPGDHFLLFSRLIAAKMSISVKAVSFRAGWGWGCVLFLQGLAILP